MTTVSPQEADASSNEGEADVYVLPASFAQGRLWFLYQLEPDSAAYNIDVAVRLIGDLRVEALAAACVALVSRHEVLRSTLGQEGSEPVQVVHPAPLDFPIRLVDFAGQQPEQREGALRTLIADIGRAPFDLERGPLLRVTVARLGDQEHVLVPSMHHVVSDGWSLNVFMRELGALYTAALHAPAGRRDAGALIAHAALEPLPIQYADYALWQREWLSGEEMERQEAFWRGQLGGQLPTLELPTDRPRPPVQGYDGATYRFDLPLGVSRDLQALGRSDGATLFMTLLAAYGIFLRRYTGDEDFVVGTPIAGRTRSETEGLIGMFVNTLALRVDLTGEPTFREVLARVRHMLIDAYAHQEFPFDRLVHMLQPVRDRRRTPLFQTMFDLQNTREAGSQGGSFANLKSSRVPAPAITAKFDIQLSFTESDAGLRGVVIYSTDLFDEATIVRMAEHFRILVTAIAANPDAPVMRLPLLSLEERERVLLTWNDTAAPYDTEATMHSLVAGQAERTPDAVALIHESGDITYAEMDQRANRVAAALRAIGVSAEVRVGVCLPRTPDLVIALLGVLKAGGTYVPLDPAYPADRNAFMLEDSGAIAVITEQAFADDFVNGRTNVVLMSALASDGALPAPAVVATSSNLAYLIYTSGSTGRPKGVAIEHRSAVALITWAHATFSREELAGVLFATSVCFDLSVFEMFVPLTCGGSIIIADNALALPEMADADRVTLVNTVPSAILALVRSNGIPDSVRTVNLAGELLVTSTVAQLYALGTVKRVYDLYGPSEDTTYSTWTLRHPHEPPNIGRPIANTQAYVLDPHGEPTPIGVPGELFLGGAGLARGYHDRPELTADRFIPNPFAATTAPDARMYRTGDRARWRRDGKLEYLGRLDHQVKIRGFRIEPGEVQARIEAIPGVSDAAVIVRTDTAGEPRLIGYFVVKAGAEVTTADVAAALRAQLPVHMVPAALMPLDAMPLTPSGKLDRRALPAPEIIGDDSAKPYKAPRSNVEHELVQIWEQLLPGRKISIYDDFFEIGGHSLLAVQMLAEVERMRGKRVPLAWLFESATVETLAARLSAQVQAEREPLLVVLHPSATGKPMAFVHGDVRGGGWYGRRLAPLAVPDSPMYLLGTVGMDSELLPWTIEEMARIHVAELRTVQPHGPYRVGGFCIGGIIAFEMAVQLQAAGARVERLVIVDSAAVNVHVRPAKGLLALVPGADGNERMTRQSVLITRLRWYELRIRQVRRQPMSKRMEWVSKNVSRRLRRLFERTDATAEATSHGEVAHDDQARELASALRTQIAAGPGASVLLMQERAASVYFPGRFAGTIDLIWANDKPGVRKIDPTRGWGHHADNVHVHPILSTHLGLVTNDLPLMADALKAVLDRDGE
ncbi:MAG: amino acid adenylation domain-containing protein [Gemmatimonadaceae bacterium]